MLVESERAFYNPLYAPVATFALNDAQVTHSIDRFFLRQVWHERHHGDPGHVYLRTQLRELASSL